MMNGRARHGPAATTGPRVAPGGLAELGVVNWALCRIAARLTGTREVTLFATLGRHRRLFRAWLGFGARMMPGGVISRHETELVIIRVAHLRGCQYELDHHLRLGRRAGIGDELAARIAAGPEAAGWSDRHRALLAAVDAMVETGEVPDPAWAALRDHYGDRELVELCLLVGHYEMLATAIATLRIGRDLPR